VSNFGGLSDSYPTTWAAYNFFANGGRGLYVKRVVGSGSSAAAVIINDGTGGTSTITSTITAASASSGTVTYTYSGATGGTYVSGMTVTITGLSTTAFNLSGVTIASVTGTTSGTFTVTNSATGTAVTSATGAATTTVTTVSATVFTLTAVNPGTWGNNYTAQVVAGGTSTRFGLNIYATSIINGISSSTLVESYTDLSMSSTDANYIGAVIPAQSKIVGISGINTAKFPAIAISATALSGGVDGSAPGRTDYSTAWSTFDSVTSSLVIYASDAPYAATTTLTTQLHGDAAVYAATRSDCFVIFDTPAGLANAAAAQTNVTASLAVAAASTSGSIVAAYWPWINIPDPTKVPGATRLQAPGAAVAGQYLNTDATRGPAKAPAGLQNRIALAVSTEHNFTNAELDALNTSVDPVNTIRQVPGAGIVVMGARTLDNTPNNRYINIRRSLIYIEKKLTDLTSFALFENNDERLWTQLNTVVNSFLFNYWNTGNLRGNTSSQAYYVICDSSNNSFNDIQQGKVNIQIGVALEYPAEFVVIKIGQLTGNASA
jgi:phage tail sheath protein FI